MPLIALNSTRMIFILLELRVHLATNKAESGAVKEAWGSYLTDQVCHYIDILKQNSIRTHYQKYHFFFKSRVKSGRYQEGSIHVCWCDQCFYNRTNIFGISTVSGGRQPPSRLSFLWTRWHQRISIPHHHCYYFGFLFCETQKGTANKVGLKLKEA